MACCRPPVAADAASAWPRPSSRTGPAQLLLDTAFTLAVVRGCCCGIAGRPERTLQTTTAVFGFQIVLAPLLLFRSWLALRFPHDSAWACRWCSFGIVLLVWLVAANSHIVKAALEWSVGASVALVILQTLASELLRRGTVPPAQN